jgi:hypothetical protein
MSLQVGVNGERLESPFPHEWGSPPSNASEVELRTWITARIQEGEEQRSRTGWTPRWLRRRRRAITGAEALASLEMRALDEHLAKLRVLHGKRRSP